MDSSKGNPPFLMKIKGGLFRRRTKVFYIGSSNEIIERCPYCLNFFIINDSKREYKLSTFPLGAYNIDVFVVCIDDLFYN